MATRLKERLDAALASMVEERQQIDSDISSLRTMLKQINGDTSSGNGNGSGQPRTSRSRARGARKSGGSRARKTATAPRAAAPVPSAERQAQALEALRLAAEPMTSAEVGKAIGVSSTTGRSVVADLLKEGRVAEAGIRQRGSGTRGGRGAMTYSYASTE